MKTIKLKTSLKCVLAFAGALLLISASSFAVTLVNDKNFYNVKDFGAKGNGNCLDTKSINAAIIAASDEGGGTVYFPAGDYLSGSIQLKSNITLYLDQGAVIVAAPEKDSSEYDKSEPAISDKYQDFGHSHFENSLIWGKNLQNISIIGNGMIWGKGLLGGYNKTGSNYANKSISLFSCLNVIIRDITILQGGWFCILATGTDNLTIENLKIDTQRDGMDIDCCQNIRITNCTVNSPNDDGICLKSSFALGYPRSTKNVTISDCQLSGYDVGTLLDGTYKRGSREGRQGPTGRIKLGTESNGGFQNITISNCLFDYCRGLALETVDGALLEDITINNITMRDVTNSPFFIRLGARMRAPDSLMIGKCRRIMINNINVYNALNTASASIISGIPGYYIEDLRMNNIHIYCQGGGTQKMAKAQVSEDERRYPEPYKFGTIPAYGFFIRHVKNLTMNDVSIKFIENDYRPPFILQDVKNATFRNIDAQSESNVPIFIMHNVETININNIDELKDTVITKSDYQSL
ncbi:MAG: glycoside hydrolase family 28 protein [Bacteroidales bacterium]|nr:glycoside hydrolase family 28 protein [Bacteroidales bacterium]MCF8389591.1 glycoside hydrolase family 28 protein [Bacteroidales bacterium]